MRDSRSPRRGRRRSDSSDSSDSDNYRRRRRDRRRRGSRSGSRERRSRSRSRDRDRRDRREGGRDGGGSSRRLSEPSRSVMVRGLPVTASEADLAAAANEWRPDGVRLIGDRGFGFIEFQSVKDAEDFLYKNLDTLCIQGRYVHMDFSHGPRDGRGGNTGTRLDWLCGHCGAHNFARRSVCFQCTHPKDHTATVLKDNLHSEIKGGRGGGEEPNPVLVVLGLAMDTTTSRIRDLFQQHADVVDVRIMRDKGSAGGSSRGFAFVQFATTEDAAVALNRTKGAKIDGRSVRISFSRDQGKAAKAAWQDPKLWERPANLSEAFKFDSRTGQYYDRKSGFYYDPASCLYYHGESGIYYRWDALNNCYLQVDERGVAITPASGNDATDANNSAGATAASSAKKKNGATSATTGEGKTKKNKASADGGGGKKKRKKKGPIAFSFSKKVKAAKQPPAAATAGPKRAAPPTTSPPPLASVQEMAAKAAAAAAAAKNVLAALKQTSSGVVVGASSSSSSSTTTAGTNAGQPPAATTLPWAGLTGGGGPQGAAAQQQQAAPSVSSMPPAAAAAAAAPPSSAVPLGQIPNDIALQRQHLQLEKKICRLCKRKFGTLEKLYQHVRMSAMHKKNLELVEIKRVADKERLARSKPPPRRVLRKGEGRRNDEKPSTPSAFEKMVSKAASVKKPISDSNKGSKMLKAMGWKKGQGLGKTKQGITAPVQADMYSKGAGLGSMPTGENAIRPGDSYHDAATKKARARYQRADRYRSDSGGGSSYYRKKKPQNAANAYLAAMSEYKNSSCTEKDGYARAMLK